MRLWSPLFLLLAAPVLAQPQTHPADRELGRVGIAVGPPGASGLSVFSPGLSYGEPCYASSGYDPYYQCGSYTVAFLVDGEYEYDVLSSHTVFFAPWSSVDPYVSGYLGFGYGDEFGFAWGGEMGVNLWLTEGGGITFYGGVVRGERQQYGRLGIGLVLDLAD
ncbi:MAG: hypothetical protein AAGI52_16005 [Bacteroidota bacterium]